MNSGIAGLPLSLSVFLLPLTVAAQVDEPVDSILTAQHPSTGEDLPTDATATYPIDGTPGDGIPDKFYYIVSIRPEFRYSEFDPARLILTVGAMDPAAVSPELQREMDQEMGTELIRDIDLKDRDRFSMEGHIDFSSDTEIGQLLRFIGSLEIPGRRIGKFEHNLIVGCHCPRAGTWTATNLPGSMVCTGALNTTIPLAANTQTGTLEVLDSDTTFVGEFDGCQSLRVTNFDPEYAEVPMHRLPDGCGYVGSAVGTPMEVRFTWDIHNEETITGSLYSEVIQSGATCVITRDFEVRFKE